jgi:hypothetical protein
MKVNTHIIIEQYVYLLLFPRPVSRTQTHHQEKYIILKFCTQKSHLNIIFQLHLLIKLKDVLLFSCWCELCDICLHVYTLEQSLHKQYNEGLLYS